MLLKHCEVCGAEFKPCKPTSTTCSPKCRNARTSRLSANKRSESLRGRGEGKTYTKKNGRHAHRVIMEEILGRPLAPGEVVHHKDHNKKNNDPLNLLLIQSQSEHARLHNKNRKCSVPGCNKKHYSKASASHTTRDT